MSMKKVKLKADIQTKYSKDKEYINALITSDLTYKPKRKHLVKSFPILMWMYVSIIFVVTALSLGMLSITNETQQKHVAIFTIIEGVVFIVLLIDLILRWHTSNIRLKEGKISYLLFPFTVTGALLITSLLPSLYLFNIWTGQNIEILNTFEAMKFLRIFRIILLANLVPGFNLFRKVLTKEKSTLYTVFGLVLVAIILFSLVIFNIEQGKSIDGIEAHAKIKTFLDALYFSTVTLTTIGFGDITPITDMGKAVVMVMAILGVAILAIPSGVIAGGFISEIKLAKKEKEKIKVANEIKKK